MLKIAIVFRLFFTPTPCRSGKNIVFYEYMKIKQTLVGVLAALVIGFGAVMPATSVYAVDSPGEGPEVPGSGAQVGTGSCGEAKTAIITCNAKNDGSVKENAIWQILVIALNIMMAGVGILAVAGIVYGSVLYASAADNAAQVQKAKGIILNVILGLVAFGLMYTLLNFLIPGGVFG